MSSITIERSYQIEKDIISKIDMVHRDAVRKQYSAFEIHKSICDWVFNHSEYKELQMYKKHAIHKIIKHRREMYARDYTVWGYFIDDKFYGDYCSLPTEYQKKVNDEKDNFSGHHFLLKEEKVNDGDTITITRKVTKKIFYLPQEYSNKCVDLKNVI